MSQLAWGRRLRFWLLSSAAALVILLALLVGTFRLLVPMVPEYQEFIADWTSEALGASLEIGDMDVRWHWLVPELVLDNVRLHGAEDDIHPLQVDRLRVRVSLLDIARPGPLRPGRVLLEGGHLEVHQISNDQFLISGLGLVGGDVQADRPWEEVLADVLARADYEIRDSRLSYFDHRSDPNVLSDGDGPLILDLNLDRLWLRSRNGNHHLDLAVSDQATPQSHLNASLEASGPADEPLDWSWRGELETHLVDLPLEARHFGQEWLADSRFSVESELSFAGQGAWPESVSGDLSIPSLRPGDGSPALVADRQAKVLRLGDLRWEGQPGDWQLGIGELSVQGQQAEWPSSRLNFRWRGDLDSARLTGDLRYARLGDVRQLLSQLLVSDSDAHVWLQRLQPDGEVRDLLGEVRLSDGELADVSLRARLTGLSMSPHEQIPGFSGLDGWLSGGLDEGHVEIDAGPVHFDYPDLFRERITATRLQTRLDWRREGERWYLEADDIRARNPDARAQADLALRLEPGEPTWIRFNAQVPEARSDNLSDYLPAGRMPETAVDWLDRAIVAGRAVDGRVQVDGPSRPFPYEDGEGLFRIEFDVRDGALDYEPGWPRLTQADAHVLFDGVSMAVQGESGEIAGFDLREGRATIENLRSPHLQLEGAVSGPAEKGLEFLRSSPLAEWFAEPLAPVSLQGHSDVSLSLDAPLDEFGALRLDGRASLADVRGSASWLPGELSRVSGELDFTEQGVAAESIEGRYLNSSFRVSVDPGSRGRDADDDAVPETRVSVTGGADLAALKAALPDHPLLDYVSGDFSWRGQVHIPNEPGRGPIQVQLDSSLLGVDIDLPMPLGKPAGEANQTQARFPLGDGVGPVQIDYGQVMAMTLGLADDGEGTGLSGMDIHFNEIRYPHAPLPAIRIHGHLPELDLLPWLALDWGQDEEGDGIGLEALALSLEDLMLGPLMLGEQRLSLTRHDDDWQINLDGDQARGELTVPRDRSDRQIALTGQLSHLNLDWPPGGTAGVRFFSPLLIPAVELSVDALSIRGALLGVASAELSPIPQGIQLDSLILEGAHLDADLLGRWWRDPISGDHGELRGWLRSSDVAASLAAFGYLSGIEGENGLIEADLSWDGPPGPGSLEHLMGTASLRMGPGQLQDVSPGAGRVFGLLSLTALPRRLFGDFRDVFGRGLRYDSIEGDFYFVDGNAYTPGLKLEGPAANVTISGRTGLVSRDYDQKMTIETPVGASLPVAGAIAGGATMGAAMLLLSEIFREPLSRVGSLQYRIEGSWESPRLIPLDEAAEEALENGD